MPFILMLLTCFALAGEPAGSPSKEPAPISEGFRVTGALKRNVDFWVRIYSEYATDEGVIHDAKYIDKIYEVLRFGSDPPKARARKVRASKERWKKALLSAHRKRNDPGSMNEDERKVFEMHLDLKDPSRLQAAAGRKRLRFQLGQKDRFEEGLRQAGLYLPYMEETFRREGLPIELTRLPFVESSFNLRARSKVGASGIWQFMRSTGRLFLRIDDSVDERNDPLLATEAAAKLLRLNYQSLGKWPLAVTAYNHGRQGMLRAVRKVGSDDLEDLVQSYTSRSFGFASSNFYACLVAAIQVEREYEKHFGKLRVADPLAFFEVKLPSAIGLNELVRFMQLDSGRLKELNPALSPRVLDGKRAIPKGYMLRLPHDGKTGKATAAKVFLAGYSQIPKALRKAK